MSFRVHCSTLTTWVDCPRRWAARQLKEAREICAGARPELKAEREAQLIGAVFGSACHVGAAAMLEDMRDLGKVRYNRARDLALDYWREACAATPLTVDATTKTPSDGDKQINKTLGAFCVGYAQDARAELIEQPLEHDMGTFTLAGKPDAVMSDWYIDDHKFSSQPHPYQAQGGGYIILVAKNFPTAAIPGMRLIHTRRVGLAAPQPDPLVTTYDFDACLDSAWHQLEAIKRALREWDSTKKVWAFNANPNSKFCTQKTCSAWGTPFCDQWTTKTEEEKPEWVSW